MYNAEEEATHYGSNKPVSPVFGKCQAMALGGGGCKYVNKTDLSSVLCARDEEPAAWPGASLLLPFPVLPVQHDLPRILVV